MKRCVFESEHEQLRETTKEYIERELVPNAEKCERERIVDRSAFDRIIQAGGYISANTGSAPEAHATPVPKRDADTAFENATCIGCGACVAACPNGSGASFIFKLPTTRPWPRPASTR